MHYQSELKFLCDVMKKSRIKVCFASPKDNLDKIIDTDLISILEGFNIGNLPAKHFIGEVKPDTVYRTTDIFTLRYIYFLLPDFPEETLIFIGPYINSPLSHNQLLEISEKAQLSAKFQKLLSEYCLGIPVINDNSHLFVMLDSFFERIWGNNNFSVIDIDQEQHLPDSPINEETPIGLEDTLVNINLMQKRYNYENEMIQAVAKGQIQKVEQLLAGMSELSFKKRVADPLRNMKNYCIIMNTLFRKAAESGGVIPVYLDKVSSDFAIKIEQITALSEISPLMKEILHSYCRLVRKHSMRDYSPIVQKTIIFIDSDLSSNLTLSSLAMALNVSGGYLSTIFKKETGKTVTEYIRDKRIKHASYLLSATNLQIQTVALHCGIMDVQYFSKIFKKETGKTPKEYRESLNKIHI